MPMLTLTKAVCLIMCGLATVVMRSIIIFDQYQGSVMRRRTTEVVKAHDDDVTHANTQNGASNRLPLKSDQLYDDQAW